MCVCVCEDNIKYDERMEGMWVQQNAHNLFISLTYKEG
jgi:hypothetical protein